MRLTRLAALPLAALLGLVAVACSEGDTYVNTSGEGMSGINASGTGKAFGSPDVAKVQIGVQAEAPTVAAARETAAQAATKIIDSVKRNGVADKDVQTQYFNVQPVYDFSRNGTQRIIAYRVDNVLSVTIRKIDTAGKVIDDAVTAGGDNATVQGISFTIDDPTKLREAARKDAVKEAQEKAKQLADAAGVKLGKLLSMTEAEAYTPTPYLTAPRTGVGGVADTATPIETGELQVTVTVSLMYAID